MSDYQYGICLTNTENNKVVIMLAARSEHDRKNFIDDLKETILEVWCLWNRLQNILHILHFSWECHGSVVENQISVESIKLDIL